MTNPPTLEPWEIAQNKATLELFAYTTLSPELRSIGETFWTTAKTITQEKVTAQQIDLLRGLYTMRNSALFDAATRDFHIRAFHDSIFTFLRGESQASSLETGLIYLVTAVNDPPPEMSDALLTVSEFFRGDWSADELKEKLTTLLDTGSAEAAEARSAAEAREAMDEGYDRERRARRLVRE